MRCSCLWCSAPTREQDPSAKLEDGLLAQGVLLTEGCPTETGLSPMHAGKTTRLRHKADGMLEDQIGHLSQTRIDQPAIA